MSALLHLIAVVLLAIALVCAAVPTTLFGAGALVWLVAGLLTEILEPIPQITVNRR